MEITIHLFFNLSLLMVLAFFALVWLERKRDSAISATSYSVILVGALWICFSVSYPAGNSLQFDLRAVPVLIAGLYLGTGPLMCAICILTRGLFGIDEGFLANIILYAPLAYILWRVHPIFKKISPKKKIYVSVMIMICISIPTAMGLEMFRTDAGRFDAWFAYLIIPPLGIAIYSYFIEFVGRNILMYQQLVKSEKLEAVEQMGAAISHEIRNPLTAAIGFVQLLKDQSLPSKKREEYLSIVGEELQSAERVIQDYLTFSKPSLDYIEELNVRKELIQVVNILRPIANQHSVQITTHFSLAGSIRGDRQKFHQCFLNVIKNSIESMPGGGQLTITTQYGHHHIIIEVKDTGIGMTKDQLQKLGQPYYSTKGSKGTGLGMMVVFGIVKAMNGTIQVESAVNSGTLFTFTFPALNQHQ
ncbi:ATP-binding protein [Peribacillus sp. SCS-37]|uniref:ATP-binding protein n=1 Tax=Paraperibacillus esterisolvens TaxID=3115296 RepID=UPI00390587A7